MIQDCMMLFMQSHVSALQDLQSASCTCGIMPDRMVAAVVAKLELECFAAKGLP